MPLEDWDRDALLACLLGAPLAEVFDAMATLCRQQAADTDAPTDERARWRHRQRACLDAAVMARAEGL